MTIEQANQILDAVDRLSALGASIVAQVISAMGKSPDELRAQRDALSADTHQTIKDEQQRIGDA